MDETKTIGKDYSLLQLAKFALPAVLNELVINLLYTIDDGLFISRYIGSNAMAAFSVLFPLFMVCLVGVGLIYLAIPILIIAVIIIMLRSVVSV